MDKKKKKEGGLAKAQSRDNFTIDEYSLTKLL